MILLYIINKMSIYNSINDKKDEMTQTEIQKIYFKKLKKLSLNI